MNSTATTSAAAAAERARAQTSPTQNRPPVLLRAQTLRGFFAFARLNRLPVYRWAILYHLFTILALWAARTH